MRTHVSIGLVGDRDDARVAHRAIPIALELASAALHVRVEHEWIPTPDAARVERLSRLDGVWCVPGSPYAGPQGALSAIRRARENALPFLGTCGGFQHAVIEYARNALGWSDAVHGESPSGTGRVVISPLACGVLEGGGVVRPLAGTRLAAAYGAGEVEEEYLCSYGVNPDLRVALVAGPLREAATDLAGDLRAVELDGHPFFVATLFQPERAALRGALPPLVAAFVGACAMRAQAARGMAGVG